MNAVTHASLVRKDGTRIAIPLLERGVPLPELFTSASNIEPYVEELRELVGLSSAVRQRSRPIKPRREPTMHPRRRRRSRRRRP